MWAVGRQWAQPAGPSKVYEGIGTFPEGRGNIEGNLGGKVSGWSLDFGQSVLWP